MAPCPCGSAPAPLRCGFSLHGCPARPHLGLFALQNEVGEVSFILAFAFSSVTLLVFNTFDLILLDRLLFCTVQPKLMVLPGTEGMPGYRDYRFHFIGFLKGLIFCVVGGLVIALLWVVVQRLTFKINSPS